MKLPVGLIIIVYIFFFVLYFCLRAREKEVYDFFLLHGKTKRERKAYVKNTSFLYRWSFIGAFDKKTDCDYKGILKVICVLCNSAFLFYFGIVTFWMLYYEQTPNRLDLFEIVAIFAGAMIFAFICWTEYCSTDWSKVTFSGFIWSLLRRRGRTEDGIGNRDFYLNLSEKKKK